MHDLFGSDTSTANTPDKERHEKFLICNSLVRYMNSHCMDIADLCVEFSLGPLETEDILNGNVEEISFDRLQEIRDCMLGQRVNC